MTFRSATRALITTTAASALVVGASACKVDQAREVATYRSVVDITPTTPTTRHAEAEPLTLAQALLLANAHNERLSIEGENYLQSLINKKRAAAAFLPTVNFEPSYGLTEAGGNDGHNVGGFARGSANAPVTGTINLFNGFSDVANLRSADYTIEQRRALLLDLQESILLDAARTYYQVLKAERSVDVLTNSLAVQEQRVSDIRGKQAAGVARPLDVAQTEAQAAATRVSLIAAKNDVVTGRSLLALLTGAPVENSPLINKYPEPVTAPTSAAQLLDEARAKRQDLRAAEAAARAAREQVDVAIGRYYPNVSLDTNAFLYYEPGTGPAWTALLRANLPIFSAGLIEADVRDAWSRFRQALLFRSFLTRQVRQDVDVAYQNLSASNARIRELLTQLTAADQAFRAADQSYNIGSATNLERVVAQDALLTAQLQLTAERFDNKVFYLNLLRAVGGLREQLQNPPTTLPTTQPIVQQAAPDPITPNTTEGG